MEVRLSSRDLRRLLRAQQLLLSPFASEDREAWALHVILAVKELVGCDIGSFVAVSDGPPIGVTEDFDRTLFDVFARFDEDDRDHVRALQGALSEGRSVFTAAENLTRYTGRRLEDTRVFQEFMAPAGVLDGASLQVALPAGAAVLAVAHAGTAGQGHGYQRETLFLSLLAQAFAVGAHMLACLENVRHELTVALDAIPMPIGIRSLSGAELARNSALAGLLRSDPELDRSLEAVSREVGLSVTEGRKAALARRPVRPFEEVATRRSHYRVRGCNLGRGVFAVDPSVLLSVEPQSLVLPDVDTLRAQRGLSRREAEVTLLLARGASNKSIARDLGIRPSTVRTLVARALTKLGVHSRKALALELLRPR